MMHTIHVYRFVRGNQGQCDYRGTIQRPIDSQTYIVPHPNGCVSRLMIETSLNTVLIGENRFEVTLYDGKWTVKLHECDDLPTDLEPDWEAMARKIRNADTLDETIALLKKAVRSRR